MPDLSRLIAAIAGAAAILFPALVLVAPAPASAAPANCLPHAAIAARLQRRFGETLHGRGAVSPVLIELFANARTGTFTILVVRPGRPEPIACIAAAGDGWTPAPASASRLQGKDS